MSGLLKPVRAYFLFVILMLKYKKRSNKNTYFATCMVSTQTIQERQVKITDINEELISEYAKKIYGFAYSKTQNYHDAQDLSQNILMQLCRIDFNIKQISDMNGYIYKVCQYTWSNFVRKNIFTWEGLGYEDEIACKASEENLEDKIVNSELYQKLRREIMYLGKCKRETVVLFYYEGKSGKEISEILGIPASTVRWYLGESKKILKERIEMTDTMYTPKKLTVYFSGWCPDFSRTGLRDDMLVQNICIVCAKKALTIEEIAQTMCMSAAFIENKLDALVDMNYLEKVNSIRYRTTFFIKDADFILMQKKYEMEHRPPVASAIYSAVSESLEDIRKIGFNGCDLNDNFLMWAFTEIAAGDYDNKNAIPCKAEPPIRGDGSKHWIDASWSEDEIFKACDTVPSDLKEYIRYSDGSAGKHSDNDKIAMVQYDPAVCTPRRQMWFRQKLSLLQRVYTIIQENLEPNEYDKEIIAQLSAEGYVAVHDGKPVILIPYFTFDEYKEFCRIMDDVVLPKIEKSAGKTLLKDYADFIESKIPSYLSNEEKEFVKFRFYQPNAYAYLLYKTGNLAEPTENEKKRICTIVWEYK